MPICFTLKCLFRYMNGILGNKNVDEKNSTLKNIITLGNNQVQKVMVRKADVSQYFREH